MKIFNYVFVLAFFASFSFIGCTVDEIPDETEIIGTWLVKSVDLIGTAQFTQGNDVTVADFTGEGYDMDLELTINENPNDYTVQGDVNVLVTYDVDGQTIELPIEEADFIDSGTWDITGDVLTVSNSTQVQVATLGELTETSLTLEWTYTDTVTTVGSAIVQNVTGTYIFEKQ